MRIAIIFVLTLLAAGCMTASIETNPDLFVESNQLLQDFAPSTSCKSCHPDTYEQFADSMHAKSFANPVFQAQYLKEILPKMQDDPGIAEEARRCVACHAPTVYMKIRKALPAADVTQEVPGVTCDFCHTLTGVSQKGEFQSRPEKKKMGPFERKNSWHSEYGGFVTISEFCAGCHNGTNHNGLEIKSTYAEWKSSIYARRGVQCQNCHMNAKGYLTPDGKEEYEKGKAAYLSLGFGNQLQTEERDKLYTHLFPGAHSRNQIDDIIKLKLSTPASAVAGEKVAIKIAVDNSNTGHKMPSGSTDIRFMYLDVAAEVGGKVVPIKAPSRANLGQKHYDVVGGTPDDAVFGNVVPAGARLYRTVFTDAAGKPTLSSFDAVAVAFDNRLNAAEVREETYRIAFDERMAGPVTLKANLVYVPYPQAFARKLGLPNAQPVVIASSEKKIIIRPPVR